MTESNWNPEDPYCTGMTVQQVAHVLGRSYQVAVHLVSTGKIQAARIFGAWMVNPEAVRRYKSYLEAKEQIESKYL